MGKTTTKFIVALAAVFVLIAVFQARRTSGPAPEETRVRALFPGLDLAKVAEVQIDRAGAGVTLRQGDSDSWGVEQREGYPVDGEKLRRLVLGITQLQVRDRLTENPDKYDDLGLGDPPDEGTITLKDGDGQEVAVLRLGQRKQAKGPGGASGQFVRAGDDPAVYLVANAPRADTGATAWIDRKLLDLAADQVMAVSVNRPVGSFSASRQQPADPLTLNTSLPSDRIANSSALGDLGRSLVNLTCDDVQGSDDKATEDLSFDVTFAVEGADRVRYMVSLARRDDKHYARLSAEALPEPLAEDVTPAPGVEEGEAEAPPAVEKPEPASAAEAFNSRHQGWTYSIPKHAYDRMAKTLDDLLATQDEK